MASYKITTDSSADLFKSDLEKYDIDIARLYISFDSETYYKDGLDLDIDTFYKKMEDKSMFPKTSLPSIQDFMDIFSKILEAGNDVLHFSITSKFSGAYQSALNAKNLLLETFPDRRIEIIDSKLVTYPLALLVIESCRMIEAGFDIDKNIEISKKLLEEGRAVVTVDSLSHLQRGGRIGKAQALAGTLLNIKPIIYLKDGELIPFSKVRGRKKALNEIMELAHKDMGGKAEMYNVAFIHSAVLDECVASMKVFKEKYNYNVIDTPISFGPVVGTHIGTSAIAVGFCPKYEFML